MGESRSEKQCQKFGRVRIQVLTVELGGEEAASAQMGWRNRVPEVKVGQKNSAESIVRSEYRY